MPLMGRTAPLALVTRAFAAYFENTSYDAGFTLVYTDGSVGPRFYHWGGGIEGI
jgi:hypothetical protein